MSKILLNIYRWVFARPQLQKANLFLFHLGLRGLGVLNYENDRVSGEGYLIKKLLPSILKKESPVFFDVGANVGNYAAALLKAFPAATVHAFEPHPDNFSRLQSIAPSNKLRCYNIALGELRGELTLFDRADENGSSHASLYEAVISDLHKQGIVKLVVPVETLDEFCAKEEITEIDFMKVDTEGGELSVLFGAKRMIADGRVKCIHFEFNEMNIVSRRFFADFRKALSNFNLYRLLPKGLLPLGESPIATELFAYQNIIAIPKSLAGKL